RAANRRVGRPGLSRGRCTCARVCRLGGSPRRRLFLLGRSRLAAYLFQIELSGGRALVGFADSQLQRTNLLIGRVAQLLVFRLPACISAAWRRLLLRLFEISQRRLAFA